MKPTKVFVHWSEAGDEIAPDETFLDFQTFEERAARVARNHKSGGYLKTKVTVHFDDGSTYQARIDLAADDEHGFQDGIEKRIAFHESPAGKKRMAGWPMDLQTEYADLYTAWKAMDFSRPKPKAPASKPAGKRNPIYSAAAASWAMKPGSSAYVSTTNTAKLIRVALKARFPKTKFSVRSDKYAGGSSIRVGWTDGPTVALVDAVVQPFAGSGFDGMTDSKYNVGAWLMPDGSAEIRKVDAHYGADRAECAAKSDGAIPVSFAADFVFTDRGYSADALQRTLTAYCAKYRDQLAEAIEAGKVFVETDDYFGPRIHGADSFYDIAYPARDGGLALYQMRHRRMLAS